MDLVLNKIVLPTQPSSLFSNTVIQKTVNLDLELPFARVHAVEMELCMPRHLSISLSAAT